jgi:hypothetical protein
MKLALVLASLAFATLALPVAAAGPYEDCMYGVWYPSNPPGWAQVCSALVWVDGNPVTPLAGCLASQLTITIIGVNYNVAGAVACL